MAMRTSVREAMLAAVPSLRAFAISLCGNVDRADDLVQETLLRAMANINSFQPGTNMSAWLFTILRNLFRSEYRKRRREVEDRHALNLEISQLWCKGQQLGISAADRPWQRTSYSHYGDRRRRDRLFVVARHGKLPGGIT